MNPQTTELFGEDKPPVTLASLDADMNELYDAHNQLARAYFVTVCLAIVHIILHIAGARRANADDE